MSAALFPAPLTSGNRPPLPPKSRTTFAGGGDGRRDPEGFRLREHARRLIRFAEEATSPDALEAILENLKITRNRCLEALTSARLIESDPPLTPGGDFNLWIERRDPATEVLALVQASMQIEEAIARLQPRLSVMRSIDLGAED